MIRRRLLAWFREPQEPVGRGRHRVYTMADLHVTAAHYGGVLLPAMPHVDAPRPVDVLPTAPNHVGATEEFGTELAGDFQHIDIRRLQALYLTPQGSDQ